MLPKPLGYKKLGGCHRCRICAKGNKGRIRDAGSKREGVNRNIRKEEEMLVLKGMELRGIYGGKRRSWF